MGKLTNKRIDWLIKQKRLGKPTSYIANALGVSKRWIFHFWKLYRNTNSIPTLQKRGRKPVYSEEEEKLLIEIYDKHKVAAVRLEKILRHEYKLIIGHNKIHEILKKYHKSRDEVNKKKRRKWVKFERDHSMSLWQTDYCEIELPGKIIKHLIAFLDDSSRYIVAFGLFDSATSENAVNVLEEAIKLHGTPREILTDRGTQFYDSETLGRAQGKTLFQKTLEKHGIVHILGRVHHPQTQGKIERFHWEVKRKLREFNWDMEALVNWHNEIKPHMSLDEDDELVRPRTAFYRRMPPELLVGIVAKQFRW